MSSEPPALRASDADRERAVETLQVAAADGRITAEELEVRVETALSARTIDDLAVLTADLPATPSAPDVLVINQEGGKYRKAGRWVLPGRIEIRTKLCKVTLDLTEAIAADGVLRIDADMKLGSLTIVTAPGMVIDADGLALAFSKTKLGASSDAASASPSARRLRIEVVGRLNNAKLVEARP